MNIINSKLALCAFVGVFAMTGCNQSNKSDNKASAQEAVVSAKAAPVAKEENKYKYSLADGLSLCVDKFKAQLGDTIKISDFSAYYALPAELDSHPTSFDKDIKGGELKSCDLKMQNPDDPKKLVAYRMNTKTDKIDGPIPVDITVTGNAEAFKLSDHVYPLANIDFAAIQSNIDGLKPKIEAKYSKYQVSGVRMDGDLSTGKPEIIVHLDGVLKANDIKKNILLTLTPDGKKITHNSLN